MHPHHGFSRRRNLPLHRKTRYGHPASAARRKPPLISRKLQAGGLVYISFMHTFKRPPGTMAHSHALSWPQPYPAAGPYGGPADRFSAVDEEPRVHARRSAPGSIQARWRGEYSPDGSSSANLFWPMLHTPDEPRSWPVLQSVKVALRPCEQWRAGRQALPVSAHRPDTRMRDVVEQGIAMLAVHGPRTAAQFMTRRNVPFAVIVRVLSEPRQRRRFQTQA